MAVSCDVSDLDLQNSVENCIDTRKQTKLFQDVIFACLFAALVGKNAAACCSHCSSHCAKFRSVISLVFRGYLKTMFVLIMTVMFMGGGWRVKWSPLGYGYFIGLPGSWHHRIHPCHADEFHLVSIMSICIVKLSLYCKANSGNNWLVRFLMVLERRTRAHVNNSSSTCKRGIRIVENSRCKHQPIKAKKRSTLDDPSGQVELKWNKGMRKAP